MTLVENLQSHRTVATTEPGAGPSAPLLPKNRELVCGRLLRKRPREKLEIESMAFEDPNENKVDQKGMKVNILTVPL